MKVCRERLAFTAALSVAAHVAIAGAVVWASAGLVENTGAAGKGGSAITWVALPEINSRQAEAPALQPPLQLNVPVVATTSIRVSLPAPLTGPLRGSLLSSRPSPVSIDEAASGDPGTRPRCGSVTEVRANYGANPGPDSGGSPRDFFGPPAPLVPTTTAGAPTDNQEHDVQFWIRADGRVRKIAVSPPIRDSNYRRRFREAVSTFVFGPVQTPDGRSIDYVYSCVVYPT